MFSDFIMGYEQQQQKSCLVPVWKGVENGLEKRMSLELLAIEMSH